MSYNYKEFIWSTDNNNAYTISIADYKNKQFKYFYNKEPDYYNEPIIHIESPYKIGSSNGIINVSLIRLYNNNNPISIPPINIKDIIDISCVRDNKLNKLLN